MVRYCFHCHLVVAPKAKQRQLAEGIVIHEECASERNKRVESEIRSLEAQISRPWYVRRH